MQLTPLHPDFGVEVTGLDLRTVTAEQGYPELRAAFDAHSLLLFREANLAEEEHLRLARLFGPLEDRDDLPEPAMTTVSNVLDDGAVSAPDSLHTKQLIANQLWHTDSTFLPVPALANLLQARIVSSSGGETEFVSTRAGWRRLDPALQERLRGTVFRHAYTHSRSQIDTDLAALEMISKWSPTAWSAVWPNPATGDEALYIASHVYAVDGMDQAEGQALVEELMAAMTPEEAVYTHAWAPGDLIIWDERATMHRGRPWPYDQPRVLASICVTARDVDGLSAIRA